MTTLIDTLAAGMRIAPSNADAGWVPHPSFPGVTLKRLVTADDTENRFSALLVRIEPGHGMLPHSHDRQTEQHLVLEGDGRLTLGENDCAYRPGALQVIPEGVHHAVAAGDRGMVLMALFAPAVG
jgi:quercetin dioxygenase-like cupin family protein